MISTKCHAAHIDNAVAVLGFAADDAPIVQHAHGFFHSDQCFDFARLKHALVTHGADDGALFAARNMLGEATAVNKGHHGINVGGAGLFLHYDNHGGALGQINKSGLLWAKSAGAASK